MDETFIRNRITELRMQGNISEYQMSLDLGMNKSYIQSISSGKAMPSMKQFLEICTYFKITPLEFFQAAEIPPLVQKASDIMKGLSDEDVLAVIGVLQRMKK